MSKGTRKTHLLTKFNKIYCNGQNASALKTYKNIKKVTCLSCRNKYFGFHRKKITKKQIRDYVLPIPDKEMVKRAEVVGKELEEQYRETSRF